MNTLRDIAIVGVGYSGFSPHTRGLSFKELMFEAARRAYDDAGVDPRKDVGSFISCTEDLWEGNSIADEYMPDQVGAALRPMCTVTADGIQGLAMAFMQIETGLVDTVSVEAHSKLSDVLNRDDVLRFAFDPVFARGASRSPYFLAGLEMNRYLYESRNEREACAAVVVKNRGNALLNPRASYGERMSASKVLRSKTIAHPLKKQEVSQPTDGCVVLVLSSKASRRPRAPVWIEGIGWSSGTPWIQDADFAQAHYARLSVEMACRMAGVDEPKVDLYELDDTFSYKELQHMEAVGLCARGEAGKMIQQGRTARDADLPVNPSGGSLGVGHLVEATGLHKVLEACLQLRGEAGRMQLNGAKKALAQSWRGLPTSSGAAVILGVR